MGKRFVIEFEYADAMSGWKTRTQRCSLVARDLSEAILNCKTMYGLGIDCSFEIVSVKEEIW